MPMLRAGFLAALLLAHAAPVPAQDAPMTKNIEVIDSALADRRAALLGDIVSDDRTTRRIAVAELRGGFADDPQVTRALLQLLAAEAAATPPRDPLSTEARINVLYLLAESEDAAWMADTVAQAQTALGTYGSTGRFVMGPQEAALVDELRGRLDALSGARVLFGEIQGWVEGNTQFTDLDLFVCDYAADDAQLVGAVRAFGERQKQGAFGRIRLRPASPELAKEVGARPGQTTIIYDRGHPEEKVAHLVLSGLDGTGLPPAKLVANTGAASYWYLSVFACP